MITFIILMMLYFAASAYAIWNLVRKIEYYEDYVLRIRNQIMATLGKMRQLDSKQMFEHDDEVGVLFDDLMQTLGELRYIIYDETEKEEEENQELILD
jgi:hypothetical protein